MSEYTKMANEFAKKHGVKLQILEMEYKKHFADDDDCRYVFKCKLSRGKKSYTFDFGQSIAAGGEEPSMYDVLSCLQKYEVGSFEDFCGNFGYDEDSRKAEKIYKAVCKEFEGVSRVFEGIMDELNEIN